MKIKRSKHEKSDIDAFVKKHLRRVSVRWPGRAATVKAARVDRGKYKCEMCEKVVRPGEYEIDHKSPVIPLDGKIMRVNDKKRLDLNVYVDRLFVGPEGMSCLCTQCHSTKTEKENLMREYYKKEKKK